ncbi:hypothetical protein BDN72DRAFT_196931 [Pluteus cervinus]|uniref:Uncharacterized protein n=1 Tax=Pluteus cervinus TaxID=181527 RepID=A0ACD3AIL5_9AGAR|nr:hypothetical protein BDN72DRAFT_196931 [Pluteus cervinus]
MKLPCLHCLGCVTGRHQPPILAASKMTFKHPFIPLNTGSPSALCRVNCCHTHVVYVSSMLSRTAANSHSLSFSESGAVRPRVRLVCCHLASGTSTQVLGIFPPERSSPVTIATT